LGEKIGTKLWGGLHRGDRNNDLTSKRLTNVTNFHGRRRSVETYVWPDMPVRSIKEQEEESRL